MLKISCYENYMLAILRGKKSMKNLREKDKNPQVFSRENKY